MAKRSVLGGFVAGAVGGLVGTAALDAFQTAGLEGTRKAESAVGGYTGMRKKYTRQQEKQLGIYEHAHAETAKWAAGAVGVTWLSSGVRRVAVPAVHYLFGALCGGAYGVLAEFLPATTAGFGTVFGAALFAGASEAVLPAMGLIPGPMETPVPVQVGGLAAHAVYGATTEGVRRLVRQAF